MKKLTLFTLIVLVVTVAKANERKMIFAEPVGQTVSIDDIMKRITTVRYELGEIGYSTEMINALFGDENFYFPSTREKLNTVIYIIDHLISNGQYEEAERSVLLRLANDAFSIYNNDT